MNVQNTALSSLVEMFFLWVKLAARAIIIWTSVLMVIVVNGEILA